MGNEQAVRDRRPSPPDAIKVETVGKALPGVEIALADDSESSPAA